jgi:hypothetical protein
LETAQSYLLQLVQKRMHPSRIAAYEKELSNMDIPALRQEIYNERFRELSFEGHRWFDLRRTTQPQLEKTYAGTTYTLKERDARYTLRIPSEAIAANPELSDEQQ